MAGWFMVFAVAFTAVNGNRDFCSAYIDLHTQETSDIFANQALYAQRPARIQHCIKQIICRAKIDAEQDAHVIRKLAIDSCMGEENA